MKNMIATTYIKMDFYITAKTLSFGKVGFEENFGYLVLRLFKQLYEDSCVLLSGKDFIDSNCCLFSFISKLLYCHVMFLVVVVFCSSFILFITSVIFLFQK